MEEELLKIFVGEVTCDDENDYIRAIKILKRLMMNRMLIPEYNFVEPDGKENYKIPEYIECKLTIINKKILYQVEKLLNEYSRYS